MRYTIIVPLAAAILVAGCSKPTEVKPKAGRWEHTIKLESIDLPGMPDAMKTAMNEQMKSQTQVMTSCLTKEQAETTGSGILPQGSAPPGCKYDNFTMAAGKINATMTCDGTASGPIKGMTITGTYAEEVMDMKMNAQGEVMPGQKMTMIMNMAGKRTGDCDGTETGQAVKS